MKKLLSLNLPVPDVKAAIFYSASPFLRMDVVSLFIPDSADLVCFLTNRPDPATRAQAWQAIRELLVACARAHVLHPDLNARNILIAPVSGATPQAWLLDVDSVRFDVRDASRIRRSNYARLSRSLHKRARLQDLGWTPAEVPGLLAELGHEA